MYKLTIDKTEFDLSGDWTIERWMGLQKWDVSLDFNWPRLISESTGAPLEDCVLIPYETQHVGVALISSLLTPEWRTPKRRLHGHKLVEFNTMSIGTFIDCETALGRDLKKWMHMIVAALYNADLEKTKTWSIQDTYPAVSNYLNWRDGLYKSYASLFEIEDSEVEGAENESGGPDAAYAWYDFLMVLADEKFLNIEKASERGVYEALNYMAWVKDQAKKRELEAKRLKI